MKLKPSTAEKYARFYDLGRGEAARLSKIEYSPDGLDAIACFHAWESAGEVIPTNDPSGLESYLTGKEIHGVTVKAVAEDFSISRVITSAEIKTNYPKWVQDEIFSQAKRIASDRIGYVPHFVAESRDFSELE